MMFSRTGPMATRLLFLNPSSTTTMIARRPLVNPVMLMTQSRAFASKAVVESSGVDKFEPKESQGFARLTKHYKERKAMEKVLEDMHEEMTFNHLPYSLRFLMFLNRVKFRLFVIFTLGSLFSYWGNVLGLATSKVERFFKKYKRRWIYKHHRQAMTYASALETRYEPSRLSR